MHLLFFLLLLLAGCDKDDKPEPTPPPPVQPIPEPVPGGCSVIAPIPDGPGARLWKPCSEGAHNARGECLPVVLMPSTYKDADISVLTSNFTPHPTRPVRRHCCEHNGNRDHTYLDYTGHALAEHAPIYVRYQFRDGQVHCFKVVNPESRED